jgi:hypothetical protein
MALLHTFFIGPGLLLSIFNLINLFYPYDLPNSLGIILKLISIPLFWSVMFGFMSAIFFLLYAFIRVRLRINQQKFFFTYEPCNPQINVNSVHKSVQGLRQAIAHLEYIKRPSTKGRRGKPKSQIIVWIGGTQRFTLGGYGRITEAELDWLAYELSDWLGMPIARE